MAKRNRKRSVPEATAVPVTSSTAAHDSSEHHYHYYQKNVKYLLKAAHILHYCSIAILGVFVIQVCWMDKAATH